MCGMLMVEIGQRRHWVNQITLKKIVYNDKKVLNTEWSISIYIPLEYHIQDFIVPFFIFVSFFAILFGAS